MHQCRWKQGRVLITLLYDNEHRRRTNRLCSEVIFTVLRLYQVENISYHKNTEVKQLVGDHYSMVGRGCCIATNTVKSQKRRNRASVICFWGKKIYIYIYRKQSPKQVLGNEVLLSAPRPPLHVGVKEVRAAAALQDFNHLQQQAAFLDLTIKTSDTSTISLQVAYPWTLSYIVSESDRASDSRFRSEYDWILCRFIWTRKYCLQIMVKY